MTLTIIRGESVFAELELPESKLLGGINRTECPEIFLAVGAAEWKKTFHSGILLVHEEYIKCGSYSPSDAYKSACEKMNTAEKHANAWQNAFEAY